MKNQMKTIALIFLFITSFINVFSDNRDPRVREYITPIRIVWTLNEQIVMPFYWMEKDSPIYRIIIYAR